MLNVVMKTFVEHGIGVIHSRRAGDLGSTHAEHQVTEARVCEAIPQNGRRVATGEDCLDCHNVPHGSNIDPALQH